MSTKKQFLMITACAFLLFGCARSCQSTKRNVLENHKQNVRVTLYSGGQAVRSWEFFGIVNNDESSVFFYDSSGRGVEVDGDYVIEYLDE